LMRRSSKTRSAWSIETDAEGEKSPIPPFSLLALTIRRPRRRMKRAAFRARKGHDL
jgi:hypothetical protein